MTCFQWSFTLWLCHLIIPNHANRMNAPCRKAVPIIKIFFNTNFHAQKRVDAGLNLGSQNIKNQQNSNQLRLIISFKFVLFETEKFVKVKIYYKILTYQQYIFSNNKLHDPINCPWPPLSTLWESNNNQGHVEMK